MAKYQGIAAMYMSMPMAAQALPILGSCSVDDKKIALRFPLSNVSFDLPEAPREGGRDMEFQMSGPKGDMKLKISYKADLQGFVGQGQQDGHNALTFVFYRPNSGLTNLASL